MLWRAPPGSAGATHGSVTFRTSDKERSTCTVMERCYAAGIEPCTVASHLVMRPPSRHRSARWRSHALQLRIEDIGVPNPPVVQLLDAHNLCYSASEELTTGITSDPRRACTFLG